MSVYSGKNSDSTLWGALKRRFTRKGRRSEKQERELGRDRNSVTSERNFESLGYKKHELETGSEIYLATLDEDLFFEYDEPKPVILGDGLFDEPKVSAESEVYEDSFINSPCFAASPQVVTTSSMDVPNPKASGNTDSEKHFCESSESVEEPTQSKEDFEMDVERLPAAPLRTDEEIIENQDPSSEIADDKEDTIEEQVATEDLDVLQTNPLLYSCRYPELMSPVEILALPQEIEYSTTPKPPEIILLPEATDFGNVRVRDNVDPSYFDTPASASTSDTEYDSKTSSGYDVTSSVCIGGQVTATSTTIENILVNYADFAGYDFLPEVTDPVRREPRQNEYTVSPAPESVVMEDEVFGVMMLTMPELASDAFELMDSSAPRFEESVEDEVYASVFADSKSFVFGESPSEVSVQIDTSHEISLKDDLQAIDSVSEDALFDEQTSQANEKYDSDTEPESLQASGVKPKISFIFGNEARSYDFY